MNNQTYRRASNAALLLVSLATLTACGSTVVPRVDGGAIDGRADADGATMEPPADVVEPVDVVEPEDVADVMVSPVIVARAIAPLSTSSVTSQRPTLSWSNAPGYDGVLVELSRSRDFSRVAFAQRQRGTTLRLPDALAPGLWFWRLRAWNSAGETVRADVSAPWWFRVGHRSADGDRDRSWGTELDVNGDGFADVAVGASASQQRRGRVDVYYGGAAGLSARPSVTLVGQRAGDRFGASVASAGDINGDGFADLVVGAPEASPGEQIRAGLAMVYLGSASGLSTTAARTIEGPSRDARLGNDVASAGDVNGDGFADLVVAAYSATVNGRAAAGMVQLFHGSAIGLQAAVTRLEGSALGDMFGASVAGAGDVNDDGFADVVIGAASTAGLRVGIARVFHGSAAGVETRPAVELRGESEGDLFAQSLAGAGDVNGDGFADIVIGARQATVTRRLAVGVATVYLGGAMGVASMPAQTLDGVDESDRFGWSVSSAGDVNGDGFGDIVIGSASAGSDARSAIAGIASVFHGGRAGVSSVADRTLEAPAMVGGGLCRHCAFGFSVAGAGDVNGDGFGDVVVGAPGWASALSTPPAGPTALFSGGAMGVSATPAHVLRTAEDFDEFGCDVARSMLRTSSDLTSCS